MQDPNQVISRLTHVESDLEHLGGIIKGDGKDMGIGPMVLQHDADINGDDGLKPRVRKLEDSSIRTAAWVGGAVAVAFTVVEIAFRLLDHLSK